MKTIPIGMQADLDAGATTHCHCWRLDRNDGMILGFTDHDNDLSFDGVMYEAASGFTASALEQSLGGSVDNSEVAGALTSDKLEEEDIVSGLWDNASITIYRVDWKNVSNRVILLKGSIGEISRGSQDFSAEVRSLSHMLNQPFGNKFLKICQADFGDARCKKDISALTFTGTVLDVSTDRLFRSSTAAIIGVAAGKFNAGKITWNTGLNAGQSMDVKGHQLIGGVATIILWEQMSDTINIGDSFTIVQGCPKSIEACAGYNNVVNFRGFPRIPGNDILQYFAKKDGNNDGGSLWS